MRSPYFPSLNSTLAQIVRRKLSTYRSTSCHSFFIFEINWLSLCTLVFLSSPPRRPFSRSMGEPRGRAVLGCHGLPLAGVVDVFGRARVTHCFPLQTEDLRGGEILPRSGGCPAPLCLFWVKLRLKGELGGTKVVRKELTTAVLGR